MSGKLDKAKSLADEAFEALEDGDLRSALKLGRRLEKMRYSAAFEIQALVYAEEGKLRKAIAVLERGVKKAPTVWLLWQLLGNYRSDQGQWDKAFRCYRQALDCPTVDASSVHLNQAIALGRCGKYDEALSILDLVTNPDLRWRAASRRLAMLNAAGRFSGCISLAQSLLGSEQDESPETASIYSELAFAFWKLSGDPEPALAHAWKALALDKKDETAAWIVREADSLYSSNARHIQVMICGRWTHPIEGETSPPGFFVNYQVVADTPEEALEFIRRFEPEGVRDSLSIEEFKIKKPARDLPKGVYEISTGYLMFPWEE